MTNRNDTVRHRTSAGSIPCDQDNGGDKIALEKRVGLPAGVALVVGSIIGSGIFISPKGIVAEIGSAGAALIVWTLCGLLALIASLCYAELGTMIQESGGEYGYLKQAYGKTFGNMLAFLYTWTSITVLKPCLIAIITLTSGEYLMLLFFSDDCGNAPQITIKLTTVVMILLLTWINCYSVELAAKIQVFFLVAKLLALCLIIIGGFVKLAQGYRGGLEHGFEGTVTKAGPIAIAFYNGMWAYDGWNQLNLVTEELINPKRNLPLTILIGIPLVIVVYLLVNISYFTVMTVPELLASPAVAMTWAELVIPNFVWIIPLSVAMSTFGASNGSMFASGRINFVAARDGNLTKFLSYVHVSKKTPYPAIMILCIISICYVIPSNVGDLLNLFSFTIWLFYGLTFLSLLIMRFVEPYKSRSRPYKVPLVLPIIAFAFSVYLVLAPIIDSPSLTFLFAVLFVLAGLVLYVPFVVFKRVLPGTDGVTTFSQLFLQVAPPPDFEESPGISSDQPTDRTHQPSNDTVPQMTAPADDVNKGITKL